jgi:MFS transporter, putative metabolite transport protein
MTGTSNLRPRSETEAARSVQDYIDERPVWADGTVVSSTPMTAMQWRIWILAAAGKFFEGLVVFMTGVATPLIADEFHMTAAEHGLVSAATLLGILTGAVALGGLADYFGRKLLFIGEMIIFVVFLVLLTASPSLPWLVLFLFGIGLALGCDYPTAHLMISESTPSSLRGRLVLSAFGFQALGVLAGTAIGYEVLHNIPDLGAWRWMYATAIIPAVLVTIGRFFVLESASWQLARGRVAEAEQTTVSLLRRHPPYPRAVRLDPGIPHRTHRLGHLRRYAALFSRGNRRATILASVPWFLQDLGTYGIGIFTPTILATAIGHRPHAARNLADLIHNDLLAAKGAALIDLLLLIGIVAAVLLADKVSRITLQGFGFIGCAAGLLLAALSTHFDGSAHILLIFAGFMLFNFMTNLGPNAQTYLLAGEVFPTGIRALGAGFAAAFAKIGAVTTAFLFPILLADIGTRALLHILVITSLIGAVVTWVFRIETTRISLDQIGTRERPGHRSR